MPLSRMFEKGVFDFFASNMDGGAFRSDHWTFIHIPKTAGSSFREEIANVKQPDYNVEPDYSRIGPDAIDLDYGNLMNAALERYCYNYFDKTRFVSGHFKYRDLLLFNCFQQSKLISLIRHPLERLKSDFLHRTSTQHPHWEETKRRYPSFSSFVEDAANQNAMFEFLCRDMDDSLEDTLVFLCDRYTWIGIQERYTFTIKVIFALFGMRIDPRLRLRETASEHRQQLVVTDEDRRRVAEVNQLDYGIYRFFEERYRPLVPAFFKLHDYDRLFRQLNGLPT